MSPRSHGLPTGGARIWTEQSNSKAHAGVKIGTYIPWLWLIGTNNWVSLRQYLTLWKSFYFGYRQLLSLRQRLSPLLFLLFLSSVYLGGKVKFFFNHPFNLLLMHGHFKICFPFSSKLYTHNFRCCQSVWATITEYYIGGWFKQQIIYFS